MRVLEVFSISRWAYVDDRTSSGAQTHAVALYGPRMYRIVGEASPLYVVVCCSLLN